MYEVFWRTAGGAGRMVPSRAMSFNLRLRFLRCFDLMDFFFDLAISFRSPNIVPQGLCSLPNTVLLEGFERRAHQAALHILY